MNINKDSIPRDGQESLDFDNGLKDAQKSPEKKSYSDYSDEEKEILTESINTKRKMNIPLTEKERIFIDAKVRFLDKKDHSWVNYKH